MKKFLRILLTFIAIIIAILVLLFLNNSGILATPPARDKIVSNELLFSDGVTKAYVLKEESYFSDFGEGTTRNVVCNLVIAKPDKQKIIKSLIRDNYFH